MTEEDIAQQCPVCAELTGDGLLSRRNFDGILHVSCRCCGYDRCQELSEWRTRTTWVDGFCAGCQRSDEVAMRERNRVRIARIKTLDEELDNARKDPAVSAYLATQAAREETWGSFERMDCDDSYG